jgi:hypothetical protein
MLDGDESLRISFELICICPTLPIWSDLLGTAARSSHAAEIDDRACAEEKQGKTAITSLGRPEATPRDRVVGPDGWFPERIGLDRQVTDKTIPCS